MRPRGVQTAVWRALGGSLVSTLLIAGCVPQPQPPDLPPEPPPIVCPPRLVMENGDYTTFLNDNRQVLAQCAGGTGCDEALFNLGVVHADPQSPYYNPAQAVQYFDQLTQQYPRTSWASAGRAWYALLHENRDLEEKRRRLQHDLRTREGTIRNLRGQIGRSRELDLQLDKKERELLR